LWRDRLEKLRMPNSLLERRRIEAQFAKAIFDVLIEETGRERAVEILSEAVIRLAIESGTAFAGQHASGRTRTHPGSPLISWLIRKFWRSG
jgi:hypothetical protein